MSATTSLLMDPVHQGPADVTPPDAPGDHAALDSSRRPPLVGFVLQYWKSEDKWKALALLAITIGITFLVTYLMVWANKLVGEVTDAIVNKRWDILLPTFATGIGVGVLSGLVVITNVAIGQILDLRWRAWLTERFLARWTSSSKFYDIERDGLLLNADQRIAEDVRIFTDTSLNLFGNLVSTVTHIITFVILLWGLSQTIEIELFGSTWVVYGYMVYIAFAWAIGGLAVTHYFGKKLIALNMQKQGVEADYRYLAMQLRENAEQIALYKGGEREHRRLTERFAYVKRNFLQIVARTWKVDTARNTYGLFFDPLSTVAALPLYFAGKVTYGGMMRAAGAFGALKQALSFFSQAYVGFTNWLAVTNRLRDLHAALDEVEARGMGGFELTQAEQNAITTTEICLLAPTGELLTRVEPVAFGSGERWLVRGASGAGKSTLLRAIAGIWPHGSGKICTPRDASIMFLPQRSYIPSGSLAAALSYPGEPTQFSEGRLTEVLHTCGLGRLQGSLSRADHWQQKLSGGEQQRLAFARVLLHRPAFVFLDEATSALDPETERLLYDAILTHLPEAGVISIAHRESLAAYHDRVLYVRPNAGRSSGDLAQLS
ncbi:ABC transporter ATP-binding protein/permease [Paucibacter sp. PLA-PC-4]|uniref:ABC transporter ATP-binding protein/permease n=1 Tax=Paucibacter sp. PLA-PC-4 TaxID=2993655 RepID=UPI00224AED23|nr:ABC transporter ATP-binding protein/permease [Paucibacter sp. PLA-PC-4]MCX2863718.1 ABC transporter ATP-binding protein/permease [Paucibacter sp. PLA-PC-4]